MSNFLELFAQQFDETDPVLITLDTKFKELDEWSSLLSLSIIAMVDEEYNTKVTGDDIRQSNTIGELEQRIFQKNN